MSKEPALIATSSAEERLLRRGKWTYICALLLIAALNLGSHLIIDAIIHRQADTGVLVNLCGRQRMLSQRIIKIALERALQRVSHNDAAAQQSLQATVDRMALVHNGLMHGSAELDLQPATADTLAIYTGPPWNLDDQVQSFLAHARVLAHEPADKLSLSDPDLLAMEEEAGTRLLNGLDAAVDADQEYSERSISHLRSLLALVTTVMMLVLLGEALLLFRPLFQRLTSQHERLLSIGRTDPLTGCFNRRAMDELAPAAIDRARRSSEALSVLSLDLDHFKSVNDTHGHAAGDLVLQTLVSTLTQHTRSSDLLFRTGGEEFVLLLPVAGEADLAIIANRFRAAVEGALVRMGSIEIRMTVSMGGATLYPADGVIGDLLARADRALYVAKRNGRNRVVFATKPAGSPDAVPYGSVAEALACVPEHA